VTGVNSWYSQLEERPRVEAGIIVDAFRKKGIGIGGAADPAKEDDDLHSKGIAFMYAQNRILTREQYLGGVGPIQKFLSGQSARRPRGVLDILQQYGFYNPPVTRIVRDIVLLRLNPQPGQPELLDLLDRIDEELGVGIATPDQILTAAQTMYPCSAKEPTPEPQGTDTYPPRCEHGGAKVRIFVADTGLVPGYAADFPWLATGVKGDNDPGNSGNTPGSAILPYGGHGTFVAGVLRCVAPKARVHVENVFDTGGSALESDVVTRLNASFGFGFEILHLTASCMTRKNIPPIALESWLEQLKAYQGVVCVAPAGNNYTRRPSWPGAFPDVISVGALRADRQRRADFSNHGGWVDVYAPGEDLVNAFGSGTYTYQLQTGTANFTGLANWSGTSFSAPIVTGLIAARMARLGESGRKAADALLEEARHNAIPCTGPVLLPSCGDGCEDEDDCRDEDE
jgi:Subtilase family